MALCKYIYDPQLLETLDFDEKHTATYNPKISLANPGPDLKVRPLSYTDYDKGYLNLLTALFEIGDVSKEQFEERWRLMVSCPNSYYITVIEDTKAEKIVGTITVHAEYKLSRNLGKRGRVEDVIVEESYRGRQLGKLLVDVANLLCRKIGFYRVSLHSREQIRPFYEKLGYFMDKTEDRMWLMSEYLWL